MKSPVCLRGTVVFVSSVLCAAVFTACGGGGGGGGAESPPVRVDLTAANHATVAHAAAVSFLAFGVTNAVPFTADSQPALQSAVVQAPPAGNWAMLPASMARRVIGFMPGHRSRAAAPAGEVAEPRLSLIEPVVEACRVSGTTSLAVDDRDGDAMLSVGDVFTFVFSDCRETASETLNGTVSLVFTAMGATQLPSFSAQMRFTQMSQEATDGRHGVTLNGSAALDYVQLSGTQDRLTMTASEAIVNEVHTHAFGNDTVTMLQGFVEQSTYDASVSAPAGAVGTLPGSTTMTLAGNLRSALAGGVFTLSTPAAPIVSYSADIYPRYGSLTITGGRGSMRLTALSADQVRLDLDANDDSIMESSRTDTWDWLL